MGNRKKSKQDAATLSKQRKLIFGVSALIIVVAGAFGYFAWEQAENEKSTDLSHLNVCAEGELCFPERSDEILYIETQELEEIR